MTDTATLRVGLIGCSAEKRHHRALARDLYQGQLFKLSREWMEWNPEIDTWAILSGKHGLVMPDDVVQPYDVPLSWRCASVRRRWCALVRSQLHQVWGEGAKYTVIAGAAYRAALADLPHVDVIGEMEPRPRGIGQIKQRLKSELQARRRTGS